MEGSSQSVDYLGSVKNPSFAKSEVFDGPKQNSFGHREISHLRSCCFGTDVAHMSLCGQHLLARAQSPSLTSSESQCLPSCKHRAHVDVRPLRYDLPV